MVNKKDNPNEPREVPDEREFLTRQGRILAEAEARAKVEEKRRKLLPAIAGLVAIAAILGLTFWLLNR